MSKMKPLATALVALGAISVGNVALAGSGSGSAVDDRIAELERQISELKAMVSSNQQNLTVHEETITANAQGLVTAQADIEEARPMAKGTKFTYGGYIQLDAISSEYSDGKPNSLIEDFYVPSLVPVEPTDGNSDSYTSTNLHAKTSRFFFTTKTNTDAGDIGTRIELDFVLSGQGDERISNSWSSRLRHAFVKWDYGEKSSIMAGQSWSTFFNVGALPDVLDFVGPAGTIFVRQPQVRWTMGGLQLAVENPATRLNDAGGSTYYGDGNDIPDLIARYNGKWGDLSWSASGMGRRLQYETRTTSAIEGDSDEQYGYALSLAGKWMLGKDDLRFMVNYGDALGRYMGLNAYNDGYVKADGGIDTVDQWGAFLAYRHFWSPKWRSTFSVSASGADNPDTSDFAGADGLAKEYQSVHANLNYLPAPKLSLGTELIYATKELEDGRDGDMSRVQFAVKYAF
ncbi:MAG: DcaP family trimeric outer membrane transporter [Gammaproteobacteria bacterium]|nr:DcaP family trimeric outer membrane transporter [Gammaproteobacteria bacterium]